MGCFVEARRSVYSSQEERLKDHFNEVMKCDRFPLLSNFDTCIRSLPVRRHGDTGEYLRLYQLPHWVSDDDMEFLANQLERIIPARDNL